MLFLFSNFAHMGRGSVAAGGHKPLPPWLQTLLTKLLTAYEYELFDYAQSTPGQQVAANQGFTVHHLWHIALRRRFHSLCAARARGHGWCVRYLGSALLCHQGTASHLHLGAQLHPAHHSPCSWPLRR